LGFSTLLSIETCHRANVTRSYNANIISTGEEEAKEKLRVATMLWSSIPDEFSEVGLKPIRWRNADDALAFHEPPYTSTIMSKPGTSAIRGGKKDMYFDEAAFIREFPTLWQAGLPAITRGDGRVTVVSTPMGESGLYHELWKDGRFSKHAVPWWESRFMVKGAENAERPYDVVAEAMSLAPDMSTEERLKRFATEKLIDIFEIALRGDLVAFKTEYECVFVDETDAFFTWDLIQRNIDDSLPVWKRWYPTYQPVGEISIGVDLAKKRDETVMTVVEHIGDEKFIRYVHATQDDYEAQFEQLKELVRATGARRVTIDESGVGEPFMEKARAGKLETTANVEGIVFNQKNKEQWATTFKGDLQTSLEGGHSVIHLPRIKQLEEQIHGIRRTRTENGFFRFAADKDGRDDYFWSLMLALYGVGRVPVRFSRL
jgi:phage FluMu gp28-like protein